MRAGRLSALVLLVFACAALCPPAAEASVFGTVTCLVRDPQRRAVPGALVVVAARHADWTRSAVTDANGEARLSGVPVGEYRLEVSLTGFSAVRESLTVLSDTASVHVVQLQMASVTEGVMVSGHPGDASTGSSTTRTLVDRADIAATPGAGRTNGLEMVTAFVPGAFVTHDQLHLRGGHQASWLIDGVMVPNTNIASNVGPQIDPKDADYVEVHRGSYGAEYGDRTYAVFNVVPRTGFERDNDVEIVASAGSFLQTDDQVSVGGHSTRLAYYASGTGNRSDLGLQTPVAETIHDGQSGLGAFGSLVFNSTPDSQLRLVTSVRRDRYDVPNDADAEAAGAADVQRESDVFVALTWMRAFGAAAVVTVSPFYHRNAANYDGVASRVGPGTLDHRASGYLGGQATVSVTAGRHEVRAGFSGFHQRDRQAFGLAFGDDGGRDFAIRQRLAGGHWAAFAQDTFRAASWLSLTAGIRQTHFAGDLVEDATSPRVGASVTVARTGWVFRAFYGRFYQAPPLSTVSGPLLDLVTAENLAIIPLRGERDEEYQAGVVVPVRRWTIDADVFRTRATNFFDHDSIGNSNIFLPLTIEGALIRGVEVALRSPRAWKTLQAHLAYAHLRAEGRGGVSGGLTDFTPGTAAFALDHDQRHTLSAGVDAHLPRGLFAGGNVYYGSGFPDEGGPARLPGHTTFDARVGRDFSERLSLSLTALNLADRRVLIDNSPTFGGTHYNRPRELFVELRSRF